MPWETIRVAVGEDGDGEDEAIWVSEDDAVTMYGQNPAPVEESNPFDDEEPECAQ